MHATSIPCGTVVLATILLAACNSSPLSPLKSAPKASISGGAWLIKKSGESELLRGLDVFLCKNNSKADIDRTGSLIWEVVAKNNEDLAKHPFNPNASLWENQRELDRLRSRIVLSFYRIADAMIEMRGVAEKNAMRTAKTGVDAKYEFTEVPAGSYVLFAVFKFDFVAGCWEIPFEVTDSKPIQLNLENSNLAQSQESGIGPWRLEKRLFTLVPPEWKPRNYPDRK
jgi:hypothetical protein